MSAKTMNRLELEILPEAQTILVDGTPISTGYHINYFDLVPSAVEDGDYWLFACSCGDGGCAGLKRRTEVRHTSGTVTWRVFDPGPERTFVFPKAAYLAEVRRGLAEAVKLNATLPVDGNLLPYGTCHAQLEELMNMLK
jgi:hypothetical protein